MRGNLRAAQVGRGPANGLLPRRDHSGSALAPLRHSNFYRRAWAKALEKASLEGVHFHDLRHTGNMLTADAGANLRELMDRMGHASSRAAMIYLHSTDERQRKLADAVGKLARAELRKAKQATGPASGTKVARRRKSAS